MGLWNRVKTALGLPRTGSPGESSSRVPREITSKERKTARFFLSLAKTGEVYPEKEWAEARTAFEASTLGPAGTILQDARWRSSIVTRASFVDQKPPKIMVTTRQGFENSPNAKGMAECDEALYAALRGIMNYDEPIDAARQSADLTNLGPVVITWDSVRQLPQVLYLEPEDVRFDSDAGGRLDQALWFAFCEHPAPEELVRERPDLDLKEARRVSKFQVDEKRPDGWEDEAASSERRKAFDQVRGMVGKCAVWHIFLRGAFALYDNEPENGPGDEGKPHFERFRDDGLRDARRYVEVVEGLDAILADEKDRWPEAIQGLPVADWPIEVLGWNPGHKRVAGTPDWRFEKPLLEAQEQVAAAVLDAEAFRRARRWMRRAGGALSDEEIQDFIDPQQIGTPGERMVYDLLDTDGKPLLVPLEVEGLSEQDLKLREMLHDEHDAASGVNELMRQGESDYNTALEAKIASELMLSKSNTRLKTYEAFQTAIARKVLCLAHAMMSALTKIETIEPALSCAACGLLYVDEAATASACPVCGTPRDEMPEVREVPAEEAFALLASRPDAEVISWGVEALVGSDLAAFWVPGLSGDALLTFAEVHCEHGSTQKIRRLEQAKLLLDQYDRVKELAMAAGQPAVLCEYLKRVFGLLDLDEHQSLLPDFGPAVAGAPPQVPGAVPGVGGETPNLAMPAGAPPEAHPAVAMGGP